jgi:hypothetical protein
VRIRPFAFGFGCIKIFKDHIVIYFFFCVLYSSQHIGHHNNCTMLDQIYVYWIIDSFIALISSSVILFCNRNSPIFSDISAFMLMIIWLLQGFEGKFSLHAYAFCILLKSDKIETCNQNLLFFPLSFLYIVLMSDYLLNLFCKTFLHMDSSNYFNISWCHFYKLKQKMYYQTLASPWNTFTHTHTL